MADERCILNPKKFNCSPKAIWLLGLLLPVAVQASETNEIIQMSGPTCGEHSPYRVQADPGANAATAKMLAGKPYAKSITAAAKQAGLDPCLVHALVSVESGYRHDAVSPKGAVGLMQVMPETGKHMGVKNSSSSVDANLRAGTRYFSRLVKKYPGRLDLAIAAYNAGEGAVEKYGRKIPPYAETQAYVPKVLRRYQALKGEATSQQKTYLAGTKLNQAALK